VLRFFQTGGETIGRGFDPEMFRIHPKRIIGIGVEGDGPLWAQRSVRALANLAPGQVAEQGAMRE
jgi:hypothetical protein